MNKKVFDNTPVSYPFNLIDMFSNSLLYRYRCH